MSKVGQHLKHSSLSVSDFGLGGLGGVGVGGGGGGMLGPPCNNLASSQPLPSNVLSKQQSQAHNSNHILGALAL